MENYKVKCINDMANNKIIAVEKANNERKKIES